MFRGILCLILLSCFGCGPRPPVARFAASRVVEVLPEAVAFEVEFELSNTNDEPIELLEYTYSVHVNGQAVYSGRASGARTLPRWSAVRAALPVVIRRDQLPGGGVVEWSLSGTLTYASPGALAETLQDSRLWRPSIAIAASDRTSVPDLSN